MEKIKNKDRLFDLDNPVGHALLNAIVGAPPETRGEFENAHGKGEDFEVELKINGVEHCFFRHHQEMEGKLRLVRGTWSQKKLFEERYTQMFNELGETIDNLTRAVKDDIKKRYPEFKDWM